MEVMGDRDRFGFGIGFGIRRFGRARNRLPNAAPITRSRRRSAARWPLIDGALDRTRQSRIDPVAGQVEARDGGVGPRPRGLAGGERERGARLADDGRLADHGRARRAAAPREARAARGHDRSSFVRPTTAAAPLDTSDRCDDSRARDGAASNTHCIARPGRPTNGVSSTRRSNQRFTVTIGDDAMRDASATTVPQRRPAPRRTAAEPRTTARPTRSRRARTSRPPPRPHPDGPVSVRDDARKGVGADASARASMQSRAGATYIASSGTAGKAMRRRPADRGRTSPPAPARRRAPPPPRAAGSAPPAPADPTASREVAASARSGRASSRRSRRASGHPAGCSAQAPLLGSARARPAAAPTSRSLQPSASHSMTAAQQVPWRRQRRARENRVPASGVDRGHAQRRLNPHVRHRTDSPQERERLAVAAHQDVLAVVHASRRSTDRRRNSRARRDAAGPPRQ